MNMKAIHRTTVCAKCPKGCNDSYEFEFHTNCVVMVEDIQGAIDSAIGKPTTQEVLTQVLADLSGCRVVSHGRHSQFDSTVEASPSR